MQTCFTREEECCGYEEGEKELKTVKFGQQERKRALNLVCKGNFSFVMKLIVYSYSIRALDNQDYRTHLKFRNIYND